MWQRVRGISDDEVVRKQAPGDNCGSWYGTTVGFLSESKLYTLRTTLSGTVIQTCAYVGSSCRQFRILLLAWWLSTCFPICYQRSHLTVKNEEVEWKASPCRRIVQETAVVSVWSSRNIILFFTINTTALEYSQVFEQNGQLLWRYELNLQEQSAFCGLEVACWPLVPKFASSNPV